MKVDVTHPPAEVPRGGVEKTAHRTEAQPRWRQALAWIADYELVFVLIPVGAAVLVNQLPWRWVIASLGVIPLTWLVRWAVRGWLTVRTPLNIPIAMLIVMTGVALYPSVDWSLTVPIFTKMIAGLGLFYAIVNTVRSEQALQMLTGVLLVVSLGIALISLGNTGWTTNKLFAAPDVYGRLPQFLSFLNPSGFSRNIVGGTLGMLLPLCLGIVIAPPGGGMLGGLLRLCAGLVAIVVGGTVLLAQSRGALAGVLVALMLFIFWWSRWFVLPISAGVLGAFALAVRRFGLQAVLDFFLVADIAPSSQGRFELWQRAIYMLQDFPYTGIGLGTFPRVVSALYPTSLIGSNARLPHAHNLYLQAGVDLGIPGLVARMAIMVAFLLVSVGAMRRADTGPLGGMAVGATCGFVVYLVHGLVDDITFSAKPAVILWALMGLSTAIWLYNESGECRAD